MLRLKPLFRSAAFRLTLLYAAVFEISVAALFAVIYLGTAQYVRDEVSTEIERELAELHREFMAGGIDHLVIAVESRSGAPEYREMHYLLQDSHGVRLAGNLGTVRYFVGWSDLANGAVMTVRARRVAAVLRVKAMPLPGGALLAVGQSTQLIQEVRALAIRAFAWSSVATLALAVAGGVLISLGFLRRVDAIERTGREIMDGDLGRRLPVRGAGDEFDRLAVSVNRMLDRIQSLMTGLVQVTNDIAHDLRTPVARLRQRLESARMKAKTTAEYETAVDQAMADTDAILRTFAAMLRIAQIESGSRRAGFAELDLSALFATMVETYAAVAEDRGQRIVAAVQTGISLRGDRDLLAQMLSNLIENALAHSGAGARIEIALRREAGGILGIVADNGPGIPAEEREKVFRRFYRLDASRTTPGSGLGLSLVAAVADLHGISVALDDNNPGLRVKLLFPAA
ncbi:MAG: HAMP domain-containing protein [Rhodospirillaceae bacterium]|nr:HAMP domain-containing protein [Rhodospirillaceae bacterium]